MRQKHKAALRRAIVGQINDPAFGKKTLSDITEIIAYVMIDIVCSALSLEKVTPSILQEHINKQEHHPTLTGALLTQAALMLGWVKPEDLPS